MNAAAILTSMAFFMGNWLADLWYAAWLIAVVSLVWSATRFERMPSILYYSASCAVRMIIVLLAAMVILILMDWII